MRNGSKKNSANENGLANKSTAVPAEAVVATPTAVTVFVVVVPAELRAALATLLLIGATLLVTLATP